MPDRPWQAVFLLDAMVYLYAASHGAGPIWAVIVAAGAFGLCMVTAGFGYLAVKRLNELWKARLIK